MNYRLDKEDLLATIAVWNDYLKKKKIHLIACGGTALTLLNIKDTTKDIDFIIPEEEEYDYLIKVLQELGYKPASGVGWKREGEEYIFDLFRGKKVHTTELLESPLKGCNNTVLEEFSNIYIGILNHYDIIISKLFRGDGVDFEDCLQLVKSKKDQIDLEVLKKRFLETSSYNISEDRINKHLESFLKIVEKEKIYGK